MQFVTQGRWLVQAVCGLALVAACEPFQAPVTAPPTPSAAASADRSAGDLLPFTQRVEFWKATDAAEITCAPVVSGPLAGQSYTIAADRYAGAGPTSFMGKATIAVHFTSCQTMFQGAPPMMLVWTAAGDMVMTSADGDQLLGTFGMAQHYDGSFEVTSLTLTSGTGRFAGTTGAMTGDGNIDRVALTGAWAVSGTLTRPHR